MILYRVLKCHRCLYREECSHTCRSCVMKVDISWAWCHVTPCVWVCVAYGQPGGMWVFNLNWIEELAWMSKYLNLTCCSLFCHLLSPKSRLLSSTYPLPWWDLNTPNNQVITSAYYNQLYLHDSVLISLQKITFFSSQTNVLSYFLTLSGTMRYVMTWNWARNVLSWSHLV